MKINDLYELFFDSIPFQRKSSTDWILPATLGLGVGAAIGVGLGMILAPQSGEETRRLLRDSASNLKDKAMTAATEAKEQIAAKANGVTEHLGYELNNNHTS
jgi:gas vesicle protein